MSEPAPTPNDVAGTAATSASLEPQSKQELPDWAQKELSDARAEAAKYRVEKKDAVEAAKAEAETEFNKKLDEVISAKADVESKLQAEILHGQKVRAIIDAKLPVDKLDEYVGLLQGETEEELRSHADTLKTLFNVPETKNPPAVDPSQGSGVPNTPLNGDPLLNALKRKVGI